MERPVLLISLLLFQTLTGCIKTDKKSDLLYYRNFSGMDISVKTTSDWEKKRLRIIEGMEQVMGPLPDRSNLPDLDTEFLDTLKEDVFTRFTINFKAAENERVSAFLYVPLHIRSGEKLAAMLVLHGTGNLIGKIHVDSHSPLHGRPYATELAQRGYVVIAPDYPGAGDLKNHDFKNDRYESGTMAGIFYHMRCVDFLQSLPEVDPDRIGVIGNSLGGHNSIFAGVFDTRLKVIVSSCGWTLMDYYMGGKLGPWSQELYMPLIREKYNLDPEKVPFDFDEAVAALAPRPFFSNSPLRDSNFDVEGIKKAVVSITKVYDLFNARDKLQVFYPDAGHEFPSEIVLKAYQFIDKFLEHIPAETIKTEDI
jgi:hypothetical protein